MLSITTPPLASNPRCAYTPRISARLVLQPDHVQMLSGSTCRMRWAGRVYPLHTCCRQLVWGLDLAGISDMYESYESANMWPFITKTPEGLRVNFVRAEHSTFRWAGPEQAVITSYGHAVHTLHKSGHWVHADNPDGTSCLP